MPILSLYSIVICAVAAVLYAAVNEHEPDRRLALALKTIGCDSHVGIIDEKMRAQSAQACAITEARPGRN